MMRWEYQYTPPMSVEDMNRRGAELVAVSVTLIGEAG